MATKKRVQPTNIWQYANWLYQSGRITKEEHETLYHFADQLEEDTFELCL